MTFRRKRTKKSKVGQAAQKAAAPLLSEVVTLPELETGDKPLKNLKLERAALMLTQDEFTDKHIALVVGCARSTLAVWKKQRAFRARVAYFRSYFAEQALRDAVEQGRARAAGHDDVRYETQAVRQRDGVAYHVTDLRSTQEEPKPDLRDRARAAARPISIASVICESPEQRQRKAFEEYCYGPKRDPVCLDSDLMHRHSVR